MLMSAGPRGPSSSPGREHASGSNSSASAAALMWGLRQWRAGPWLICCRARDRASQNPQVAVRLHDCTAAPWTVPSTGRTTTPTDDDMQTAGLRFDGKAKRILVEQLLDRAGLFET